MTRAPGSRIAVAAVAAAALLAIVPAAQSARGDRPPAGAAEPRAVAAAHEGAPQAIAPGGGTPVVEGAPQPNVVFILSDDQRADTLWAMDGVNRLLVDRGVTFRNAFATNSLCCPSRSTILTGNYSHTTGVYTNSPPYGAVDAFHDGNRAEQDTLPMWLQAAGYRTGLFGKYMNLYKGGYVPPGWDEFAAGAGAFDPTLYVNGVGQEFPGAYHTTLIGDMAAEFIEETPTGQPFFVYLAPFAPHQPAQAEARYEDKRYPDAADHFSTGAFAEDVVDDKPAYIRDAPQLTETDRRNVTRFRIEQLQALESIDDQVERIVDLIAARGQLEDTVFVYMSDNGLNWGDHRLHMFRKSNAYDGASRLPLVIRYDRLEQPARVETRLASNIDIAPTIAALAGAAAPSVEGWDLSPLLRGETPPWTRKLLLEHVPLPGAPEPAYCGIRTARYLYVRHATGEGELYDSAKDPDQLQNRYGRPRYAPVEAKLLAALRDQCEPAPPGYTVPVGA